MAATLRERLGLPQVGGRGAVLAAAVIDSLGSGLFLPVAVVYFVRTTPLSLGMVGVGLSVASALVIPLLPVAGSAVDRYGPTRCVVASNLLQMTGFLAYLWVDTLRALIASALLVAVGLRLFWTANGALVALVAPTEERARWFALLRALRNGGFALGGLLAAITLGLASDTAYHLLVILNAASFLSAAVLMATWAHRTRPEEARSARRQAAGEKSSRYRAVFANRAFLLLLAVSFLFVLCAMVLDVLLTVYVTGTLHRGAWLAGLLFALSGVLVVATQTVITRHTERREATRVLALAAVGWAVSFALLLATATVSVPGPLVIPVLVLATLCFTAAETLAMPTLNHLVLLLAPSSQQGRYFAMQGLTWLTPQTLAPAAFTWLLQRGAAWPWITLIAACGLSLVLLRRLRISPQP